MKRSIFLLLAMSSLQAQESLDVVPGLRGMVDEYLTPIARDCWESRAARVAKISSPAQVAARQAYIRARILEEIGGFPEKTPLNARITGTLERDGYRVEKLIYESLPRYFVTANVYVPVGGTAPYPAVVGVAGHSNEGKAFPTYQRVWIALAKRGFLVLAYDPPGQGERSEYWDPELGRSRVGIGTREHTMAGLQCLLTGTNVARYEIWDGIRAVDYLLSRKDVDPKRIAVAGNSGGGTQSSYLAALEPRLAAAAPSCYLTAWGKQWLNPGPQDSEQVFANFLKDGLDFGDFLISFAPRPVKMMTAIRDFFPIDGARATFGEAQRVFTAMGHSDRIGFFEYDDTHGWSKPRREATYRWFAQWLQQRPDEGVEPDFETEPPSALNCTATGQVATSLKGETVYSLNRALAEKIVRKPAPANIAVRIGLSVERGVPRVTGYGEIGRDGYRIEKIALATEPGITVPGLAFVPVAKEGRKPAVLYVDSAGKKAGAAVGGDLEAIVQAGFVVLTIDPRGWGESAGAAGASGYDAAYQTAMRAFLVGKTMVGMQTGDVLRAFDYLASRSDVDPARVSIIGKGNGGVLALFAAALEPRIAKVACEGSVLSYMSIVRARLHERVTDIIVPGILRDLDLPDVAGAIKDRAVWLVSPRTPGGAPATLDEVRAEYPARPGFRAVERPLGWSFAKVYAEWLR